MKRYFLTIIYIVSIVFMFTSCEDRTTDYKKRTAYGAALLVNGVNSLVEACDPIVVCNNLQAYIDAPADKRYEVEDKLFPYCKLRESEGRWKILPPYNSKPTFEVDTKNTSIKTVGAKWYVTNYHNKEGLITNNIIVECVAEDTWAITYSNSQVGLMNFSGTATLNLKPSVVNDYSYDIYKVSSENLIVKILDYDSRLKYTNTLLASGFTYSTPFPSLIVNAVTYGGYYQPAINIRAGELDVNVDGLRPGGQPEGSGVARGNWDEFKVRVNYRGVEEWWDSSEMLSVAYYGSGDIC